MITLSTGKQIGVYDNTIGLSPEATGLQDRIKGGYDGDIETVRDADAGEYDYDPKVALTDAECIEVADLMIAAWTRYRDDVKATIP